MNLDQRFSLCTSSRAVGAAASSRRGGPYQVINAGRGIRNCLKQPANRWW